MGIFESKAGKMGGGGIFLLVVAGLILADMGGFIDLGLQDRLGGLFGGGAIGDGADAGDNGAAGTLTVCDEGTRTTITLDAEDKYNSGNTINGASSTHAYRLNGGPITTMTNDAGTFTASPGNTLDLYWALNTEEYYTLFESVEVPCTGAQTYTAKLAPNATLATTQIKWLNEDDADLNANTNNESLSAGDVVNLKWEVQGTFETEMPYGGVYVCGYNQTSYDDLIPQLSGSNLESAAVPNQYSSRGAGFKEKAWTFPALTSNQIISGSFTIDVDDSVSPDDGVGNADEIQCQLFDFDYVQTDAGDIVLDVEDPDDDSDVGTSFPTYSIFVA